MSQARLTRGGLAVVAMLGIVPMGLVPMGFVPVAVAQSVPPPPPQTAANAPSPQAAADQRIQTLRAQLHITDAQSPQWTAFAQTMRDNATSTDDLFRKRAGTAATMSALDNMKSYAQVARAYADNTQALATAFEALYGVLTEQQKQTIDTLFRQEAAKTAAQQQPKR
jgi:hypothetical protein